MEVHLHQISTYNLKKTRKHHLNKWNSKAEELDMIFKAYARAHTRYLEARRNRACCERAEYRKGKEYY